MKRKIQTCLSMLLITSLLMMLSISVSAATSGDYAYTVTDGEVTITKYNGAEARLTIPSEIDGYPVTAIGESAFASNSKLLSVIIPGSVKTIGYDAFHLCPYLYEVNFNEGLETIESSAFGKCMSLKTVILPEGLKTVEAWAFNISELTILKIPHSVTTLDANFTRYNPNLIIIGCAGSLAEEYANSKGITFATIPCRNHLFVRGECSCCHTLLGDIDKDGDRDMDDLNLLTSYVEGTADCPDREIADMNQDNVLDIVDENLLMRLLLGQDIWA